jgi:nicotinate phosphoribosyltransferase
MFHIADPEDVKDGKMTDVYFVRTMEVLKAKKIDKWVKARKQYGDTFLNNFRR